MVVCREECIFTIDPATARDLDDALSCKQLADGEPLGRAPPRPGATAAVPP